MNFTHIRTLFGAAFLAGAAATAHSCINDDAGIDPTAAEGRPAQVSLLWSTSDMDRRTRAAISEEAEHTVNSLWIGIYDYKTGRIKELTWTEGTREVSSTQGRIIEPDAQIGDHVLDATDAVQLHTLSGLSRIVAVANIDNYGVSNHGELAPLGRLPLRELLVRCDTWEKYCSVAALSAEPDNGGVLNTPNISLTDANMPMAGIYYGTLNHDQGSDPVDWTSDEVNCVDLPAGATKMPGTIHLRRMHAYVDFHIIPDANISFEPISWQVRNVPYVSFCQEAAGRNAGDGAMADEGGSYRDNYADSRLSRIFERRDDLGAGKNESGLQFSYYQFENKHTALRKSGEGDDYTGAAVYKDREREWRTALGPGTDDKEHFRNTGVYKSLSPTAEGDANNMASYVEIQAKVTYYVKGQNADGTGGTISTATDPDAMPRMGFVTYVVHLGYCEGRDLEARSRDFNCRRNTRYTYTIRVRGLNDIVVEAISDAVDPGKDTPGAEGEVTDYEGNRVIELDCHYGVFNIQMSNRDRTNLCWRIKAPYGGDLEVRSYADAQAEDRNDVFYNWIRFKPTTGENVLATYRAGNVSDAAADAALWTLEDVRDVAGHRHTQDRNTGQTGVEDDVQRWYTVFVDEYAYLLGQNGETVTDWRNSDWTKYVNRGDRVAWLIVDNDTYVTSPDGESVYSKVKYLITQHSIQTYYSTETPNADRTALGVEHFNETFGKNLVWSWYPGNTGGSSGDGDAIGNILSHSNGRWNSWRYLGNYTYSNGNWSAGTPRRWNTLVDFTTPDGVYPVASLVSSTPATVNADRIRSADPSSANRYYEILAACMSRNRDLDGDGRINENELRWYLPAEGKYERIMLGRNALSSWLFNPTMSPWYTIGSDPYARRALERDGLMIDIATPEQSNGIANQVHYASSDHRKFYTDEGGSWHHNLKIFWNISDDKTNRGRWPWNIRCVRNLGTSTTSVTERADQDPVTRAYTYTPNADNSGAGNYSRRGGFFDATSYEDDCLRAAIQTHLPVHTIRDLDRNLIARRFEVANQDATVAEVPVGEVESYLNDNRPCRDYSQDGDGERWRIPNQREAMMMLSQASSAKDEDIIFPAGTERFSCTKEAYGGGDRFAVTTQVLSMKRLPTTGTVTLRVRCVRDIR